MVRWLAVPLAVLLLPASAAAQSRDFLFSHPRATLSLTAGIAAPTGDSQIFDFLSEELVSPGALEPIERGDFAAFAVQAELAIRALDRLDVALGVSHSEKDTRSEFKDWVDNERLPIEQITTLARTAVTLGVKGYLKDRGRSISRLAWVPYAWAPYVTAGGGAIGYDFQQVGDFVDFETFDVFPANYSSEGTAATAYAGAGVELSLGRHLLAVGEARYLWAEGEMGRDFVDFDAIDLSGAQLTAGVAFRF